MKNRCKSLFILTFIIAILFYRADSVVAMAAEENMEPELIEESTAETEAEPAAEMESEQESVEEPTAEAEPEQEPIEEPAVEPESGQESIEEFVVEPESELELIQELAAVPDSEQTISSGTALIEWLEAHKNIGGTVKLTDHVVLDGEYSFCPGGINMPAVYVDTDKYTIIVTGEIELLSDDHLIFSGQPDGKSLFYVAEKGMLSMEGVAVQSEACALWQEEGAGLVVSDCHISGSIHYADTPFVIYQNSVCAVVETGQTLSDVLPAQISCSVNRLGDVNYNERVPLSWNLEGTETQQAERQRFELQGSFLHAASAKPVQCTVVYNDYPLTFTDVKASVIGDRYTFQGGYTKPEKALPITVISEYSFDGENWLTYEETEVTNTYIGFFIAFKLEQRDRASYSNIYIRLQWDDDGTKYFSNVLCYAADDLESVEDIGGSRGGGTSITNPPDEPQESISSTPAEDENPPQNKNSDTNSDHVKPEDLSGTDQTEKRDGNNESGVVNDGQLSSAETSNVDTEQPSYTKLAGTDAGQPSDAELTDTNAGQPSYAAPSANSKDQSLYAQAPDTNEEQVLALASPQVSAQTLHMDTRQNNYIVIVLGFVLLSVIAGAAGFYVHSRSGTNR